MRPFGSLLLLVSIDISQMTIVSTSNQTHSDELQAFPPVSEAIEKIKSVDWEMVQFRALMGVNAVGSALSVVGRSIYTLGEALKNA